MRTPSLRSVPFAYSSLLSRISLPLHDAPRVTPRLWSSENLRHSAICSARLSSHRRPCFILCLPSFKYPPMIIWILARVSPRRQKTTFEQGPLHQFISSWSSIVRALNSHCSFSSETSKIERLRIFVEDRDRCENDFLRFFSASERSIGIPLLYTENIFC